MNDIIWPIEKKTSIQSLRNNKIEKKTHYIRRRDNFFLTDWFIFSG